MMSKKFISILIPATLISLLSCIMLGSAAIVSGAKPYLQAVTTSGVYVLLECDTTDPATVEWGLTPSYRSTATTEFYLSTSSSTYVHRVKLTGLSAGTLYHYRAGQAGAWSEDSAFKTAPDSGASFRFAVYSDCRTQTAIHDRCANRVLSFNPALVLEGGDQCQSSSYADWKDEFFVPNEFALINKTPWVLGVGNHEGSGVNTKAFTQGTNGDKLYFSFDYGDVHFVVLDTNDSNGLTVGGAQYKWLDNDLASTDKPWKLVLYHKTAYVAGGEGENVMMKNVHERIFIPRGVQAVFTGHNHFYQHNLVDGIHTFQTGTIGAYIATASNAPYVIKTVRDYCFAIVDMTPTILHMEVYEDGGSLVDTIDLDIDSLPKPTFMPEPTPSPTPTPTPVQLGATLFSDDFEDGDANGWKTVDGTWSVVAADGTNVYRDTYDGGNCWAYTGSPVWTDYAVEAKVKPLGFNGTSNRFTGVFARFANGGSDYYALTLGPANVLELRKRAGGSSSVITSKPFTVKTGTWYTLKLVVVGSSLRGYVNGEFEINGIDNSHAAGYAAFGMYKATAEFDDMVVTGLQK